MHQDIGRSESYLLFYLGLSMPVSKPHAFCIPCFAGGCSHTLSAQSSTVLFQMALIPLSMSRYTIAALSNSKLNHFLPLNKAVQAHIYLGYVMFGLSILATIMFFAFLGLLCSEGESDACNKLTSEIMITGYFMIGLLVSSTY